MKSPIISCNRRPVETTISERAEKVFEEFLHNKIKDYNSTFEFQARVFYEKQRYYVTGKLEDYPPGSAYYWMRKDLMPDTSDGT